MLFSSSISLKCLKYFVFNCILIAGKIQFQATVGGGGELSNCNTELKNCKFNTWSMKQQIIVKIIPKL